MDADGDGKLTLQEWQAAHERIFKAMDTDQNEPQAKPTTEVPNLHPTERLMRVVAVKPGYLLIKTWGPIG